MSDDYTHDALTPKPYAALLRVSSLAQAQRGTIADQERIIRQWAERRGANPDTDIYWFKDEAVSGDVYIFARPEGQRLRSFIEAGLITRHVVASHSDRINREDIPSYYALENLAHENNLTVLTVMDGLDTGTEAGEFLGPVYASMARHEKRKQLKRLQDGKRRVVGDKKEWITAPPYGHIRTEDRRLIAHPAQKAVILRARDLILDGFNAAEVVRILNTDHVPAPRGSTWHRTTLMRILKSGSLYGEAHYYRTRQHKNEHKRRDPSEWLTVPCEPLMNRAEWDELQRRLKMNAARNLHDGATTEAFILPAVVCGKCGGGYYPEIQSRHKPAQHYYYRHARHAPYETCDAPKSVRRDAIEVFVWGAVLAAVDDTEAWGKQVLARLLLPPKADALEAARKAVADAEAQLARVEDAYFIRGTLSPARYDELSGAINASLIAARRRLNDLEHTAAHIEQKQKEVAQAQAFLAQIAGQVHNATHAQKRALIVRIINRVVIEDAAEQPYRIEWNA